MAKHNTPTLPQDFQILTSLLEGDEILRMMEKLLHWAAIIESSDDAIISKSADGIITSWNPGAERLYGYTADEIIGQPVSILMPPEKSDDFPSIMKQLRAGKKIEHYETQRLSKDGRIIHVSLTVSPLRDSEGNIIGASKIARNISDRIEQEKRRDEFISIASHELKTPITSQKAFGELLEQLIIEGGYTDLKPFVQKINKQTDKLVKLIEDLLELSQVQSGRLSLKKRRFNIDDLISEVIDDLQKTSQQTIVSTGKTKKTILADRDRLGQVLTNLVSNALKYSTKKNTVHVFSSVENNTLKVAVQDFGIGIQKEFHTKIFERFFRVTGEDEQTYPGMGIGLHVSQDIIHQHGGKIWVESEKGKGSTFYFTIPLSIRKETQVS